MLFPVLALFFSPLALAQPSYEISAQLYQNTSPAGHDRLRNVYRDFIVNDFVSSVYCQEGWGDGDAPIRMQKACKTAQATIIRELSKNDTAWMTSFRFHKAVLDGDSIQFIYSKIVQFSKDAPLGCELWMEFNIHPDLKMPTQTAMDLYCDH
jgi:hypothetical protein